MKNLLNNKFFIIISLFIILTFSICTNCFAENIPITFDNIKYNLNIPTYEDYPYYFFYVGSDEGVHIYYLNENQKNNIYYGKFSLGNSYVYGFEFGSNYHYIYSSISILSGIYNISLDSARNSFVYVYEEDYFTDKVILYTNFDIKNKEGNVVFMKAPQIVEQVTIPTITQVQEIPQTMNKVLEMIIPIGLIIFGIGLIIYLVRLVILRMT